MNKAQKFLLDNNLDDIVLNEKQYPENTNKWIYLSDILEQYLAHNQASRIHNVVGRSEQFNCLGGNYAKGIKPCSEFCGEDMCQKPSN